MKLHTDQQLFKDAINFASRPETDGGLGISPAVYRERLLGQPFSETDGGA